MSPRLIAFGACICIYLGAFAQDKPPAPAVDKPESVAPLSKDEETRVMELIKALGADDLEVRDKATEDLKAFGERAEALLKAAANDADAEIRSRVQCVLKSVALRKRATFSKGFLKLFPDIYEKLAVSDGPAQFKIFLELVKYDANYKGGGMKRVHASDITLDDLAAVIGELIIDEGEDLSSDAKEALIATSCGYKITSVSLDNVGWCQPVPQAAPHIAKLLRDDDASIRQAAAEALGEIGNGPLPASGRQ
jgi:HEAT repeat protein